MDSTRRSALDLVEHGPRLVKVEFDDDRLELVVAERVVACEVVDVVRCGDDDRVQVLLTHRCLTTSMRPAYSPTAEGQVVPVRVQAEGS